MAATTAHARSTTPIAGQHTPATPACKTCAHLKVYPCKVGKESREEWRCENGVKGAPERTECPSYLREVGSEPW